MQPLRGKLLEIARKYYHDFVEKHQDNSELQKDLAEAYRRLGDIGWTLGDEKTREEGYSQAVAILEQLVANSPDSDDLRHELASMALAVAHEPHSGQEANLRKAIEQAKNLRKPAHRHTLGQAYLRLSRSLMGEYSANSGNVDHRDEAITTTAQAQKLFEALHEQSPKVVDYALGLADAYTLMYWRHSVEGNFEEADKFKEQSVKILDKLVKEKPENVEHRHRLADLFGNFYSMHEQAIEILLKLVEEHPARC
jgi:tetratricopeptide (TPR) repeat protein